MQDEEIITLYWAREEAAITRTEEKYGRYLLKIADNILADRRDSSESVNDTYLHAWNSMPPRRPQLLSAYLAKITRHLAIDQYRKNHRQKRQGSQYELSLEELGDCVSTGDPVTQQVALSELAQAMGAYLRTVSPEARHTFIGRYYYLDSLGDIARYCHMSESKVKSLLYRTRQGLRRHLEQEGYL